MKPGQIVPDALRAFAELHLHGGPAIHFNGPASVPVVAVSHTPDHRPGDLIAP